MSDSLTILKSSPYSSIQSSGRIGYMSCGVSESGALDRRSLWEGAFLLGNDVSLGCVEFLHFGGDFSYRGVERSFVVVGGDFALSVNGESLSCGVVHGVSDGDIISIGGCDGSQLGYLHVVGGVAVGEVLGSCSTNLRAGLGGYEGRLLASGDILPLGDLGDLGDLGGGGLSSYMGCGLRADGSVNKAFTGEIRVLSGSGECYYSDVMVERFYDTEFSKSVSSDRLGSVLSYAGGVISSDSGLSIISDAISLGDVQIQGGGRVVVLLADRQPSGGYPRIATVIGCDLSEFVRLPFGVVFRFRHVGYEEARELLLLRCAYESDLASHVESRGGGDSGARLLSDNLISGVFSGD